MEFKSSKTMSSLGENNVIRINKSLLCDFTYGDRICLQNVSGGLTEFIIAESYIEDIGSYAFVSDVTMHTIKTDNLVRSYDEITIGCDPETIVVDRRSGDIIPMCYYMGKTGKIGNDGMLLEFRPDPSTEPDEVCRNIYELIKGAREILSNNGISRNSTMMYGKSEYKGSSTGFHLHYGIPKKLLYNRRVNVKIARLMTSVMDYYVGIPSIVPEGSDDSNRRAEPFICYGKPGGFRLNRKTFEYRTPGGANLAHPALTTGLLSLGAVVVDDLVNRICACTNDFESTKELIDANSLSVLYPNLPSMEEYFKIICNRDIRPAAHKLGEIIEDVRMMSGYSKMSSAVESYFELLFNWEKIKKDVVKNKDVERNWETYGRN